FYGGCGFTLASMGAAPTQHPAHHCGFYVYATRGAEAFWLTWRQSGRGGPIPLSIVGRGGAWIFRLAVQSFRPVYPPRGVHSFRNDGGGLLSGPCAKGILDYPE